MFTIEFSHSVVDDLADLRAFDRERLLDRIDALLTHEPASETQTRSDLSV